MRVAFITGITGQDGSYLTEQLLKPGYDVHGRVRRNSVPKHQQTRLELLERRPHAYQGDLMGVGGLERLLRRIQPDAVYNFAAQSHVRKRSAALPKASRFCLRSRH